MYIYTSTYIRYIHICAHICICNIYIHTYYIYSCIELYLFIRTQYIFIYLLCIYILSLYIYYYTTIYTTIYTILYKMYIFKLYI